MNRRRRIDGLICAVLALAVAFGLPPFRAGASPSPAAIAANPSTAPSSGSQAQLPCTAGAGGLLPSVAPGTAGPGASPEASPARSVGEESLWQTPGETPYLPTIAPTAVSMAQAWGDVPVRSIDTDLGHDRRFVFSGAATSDGEWLVGTSQPKGFDVEGKATWGPGDAVLIRVSDGTVRRMAKLTTPRTQIDAVATDGRWVVWSEHDDHPHTYGWRLRVYDRDAGTTREVARARLRAGDIVDAAPGAAVGGDRLVWARAAVADIGAHRLRHAVVREEDLRTGTVSTLARQAAWPEVSWPWIAWTAAEGGHEHTVVTNVETGQREDFATTLHFLALQGASAAWSTSEYHVVCLVDDLAMGAVARRILSDPDATYEWITLNDRAVGFYQQSLDPDGELGKEPTQVYDRVLNTLVDLPMVVGFSQTYAVGPLVVWQTPTKHWDDYPDLIQVVDTRDIAT